MPDGVTVPTGTVARVVLDSSLPQLDRLFDYAIPDALRETALPGVRVRVPLRSAGRMADGLIVELAPPGDYKGALSAVESVVSPIRVLAPEVYRLARRAADRAAGAATDILRLAVPGRQVRVEKAVPRARAAGSGARSDGGADRGIRRRHPRDGDRARRPGRRRRGAVPARSGGDGRRRRVGRRLGGHDGRCGHAGARIRQLGDPRRARLPRPAAARGRSACGAAAGADRDAWMPGSPTPIATARSCAALGRYRSRSSATARWSTHPRRSSGSSPSGMTATRCTPSRSARTCTHATRHSCARRSRAARSCSCRTRAAPRSSGSSSSSTFAR